MRKLLLAILASGCCLGQAQVVPNSANGVEGDGTFTLSSTTAAGRTYQLLIGSGQLAAAVGRNIVGFQLRLNGTTTAAWPVASGGFSFFRVFLGAGVSPTAMSNTFASNYTGSLTQVRDGALNFPAGAFTVGSSPNAFGPTIQFDTPYLYSGGDLLMELRYSPHNTSNGPVVDAVLASGGPSNGWGSTFCGRWTANAAGTSGSNANFLVLNMITEEVSQRQIEGIINPLNYDPDPSNQTFVIEIRDVGSTTPLDVQNVTPDASGYYLLDTSLPAGTYDVTCKGTHWLRKLNGSISVPGTGQARADFELINGDADPDNEVNLVDFSVIATSFGYAEGDPEFLPAADLDGDEEVTLVDVGIFSANFGQAGDD